MLDWILLITRLANTAGISTVVHTHKRYTDLDDNNMLRGEQYGGINSRQIQDPIRIRAKLIEDANVTKTELQIFSADLSKAVGVDYNMILRLRLGFIFKPIEAKCNKIVNIEKNMVKSKTKNEKRKMKKEK